MDHELRRGEDPIPHDLGEILTQDQMLALHQIEHYGWELIFVRRPLFQNPIPVVLNEKGDRIAVLEEDGRLNLQTDIKLRG